MNSLPHPLDLFINRKLSTLHHLTVSFHLEIGFGLLLSSQYLNGACRLRCVINVLSIERPQSEVPSTPLFPACAPQLLFIRRGAGAKAASFWNSCPYTPPISSPWRHDSYFLSTMTTHLTKETQARKDLFWLTV